MLLLEYKTSHVGKAIGYEALQSRTIMYYSHGIGEAARYCEIRDQYFGNRKRKQDKVSRCNRPQLPSSTYNVTARIMLS